MIAVSAQVSTLEQVLILLPAVLRRRLPGVPAESDRVSQFKAPSSRCKSPAGSGTMIVNGPRSASTRGAPRSAPDQASNQ